MNRIVISLILIVLIFSVTVKGASLSVENNTQRAGGDYLNFLTNTPDQCASECERDARCLAFDYSRHDSRCWLKNTVPHPRYNIDVISGFKQSSGTTIIRKKIRVPGMRVEQNTQRPFGDYTNFVIENAEECAWECVRDSDCLAFDYSKHDSRCWLKNMVPQSRHNGDVVSGVKTTHRPASRKNKTPVMRIEPNTQRPFGDYTNFIVNSPENCADECVRDSKCQAFDFSRHDSRCWLKNTVPHPRQNGDVVSGVKQWRYGSQRTTAYVNPARSAQSSSSTSRQLDSRLQAAQIMLQLKGYSPGKADGIMGRKTRNALKKFQKDHNLPPTGKLDQQTYELIFQRNGDAPAG